MEPHIFAANDRVTVAGKLGRITYVDPSPFRSYQIAFDDGSVGVTNYVELAPIVVDPLGASEPTIDRGLSAAENFHRAVQ